MFKADNIKIKGKVQDKNSELPLDIPITTKVELSEQELELLLVTIKNTLFKGEYVELLYNLTLKLQKEYVSCNPNKK